MELFERSVSAVCVDPGSQACPASIPFCCAKNTTCISLTSDHTSVLCCPPNSGDCKTIRTVSCELASQNATARPLATLQTTAFNVPLQSCGSQCCPRGYSCQNESCVQGSGVTTPSASTNSATTASVTSSSSTSTSSATSTSTAVTTNAKPSSSNFPTVAVVVGLIVGLLVGALITWLVVWLLARRRQKKYLASKIDDGSFGRSSTAPTYISDPFVATPFGGVQRSDFLLSTASGKERSGNGLVTPGTGSSPGSQKRTPLFTSPLKYGLPVTPRPPTRPLRSDEHLEKDEEGGEQDKDAEKQDKGGELTGSTQTIKDDDPLPGHLERHDSDESHITTGSRNSSQRPASTETISVGLMPPAPPMMSREDVLSTNTTFSLMMEQAGMRRGQGFLGYPGRWSFRP